MNLYGFVGNNSLGRIDNLGLSWHSVPVGRGYWDDSNGPYVQPNAKDQEMNWCIRDQSPLPQQAGCLATVEPAHCANSFGGDPTQAHGGFRPQSERQFHFHFIAFGQQWQLLFRPAPGSQTFLHQPFRLAVVVAYPQVPAIHLVRNCPSPLDALPAWHAQQLSKSPISFNSED